MDYKYPFYNEFIKNWRPSEDKEISPELASAITDAECDAIEEQEGNEKGLVEKIYSQLKIQGYEKSWENFVGKMYRLLPDNYAKPYYGYSGD